MNVNTEERRENVSRFTRQCKLVNGGGGRVSRGKKKIPLSRAF